MDNILMKYVKDENGQIFSPIVSTESIFLDTGIGIKSSPISGILRTAASRNERVLWSSGDGIQMDDTEVLHMGEGWLDQLNYGFCLVFSHFNLGTNKPDNWWYNVKFVPKLIIDISNVTWDGIGIDFQFVNQNRFVAYKYLYIHNDSITGNVVNVEIQNNINNKTMVLRAVIAV